MQMNVKRLFSTAFGLMLIALGYAQVPIAGSLDRPVLADDATVVNGVLRTQVLRDSLMMSSETGRMEPMPVVVGYIDVPVDDLGSSPEMALERAKTSYRARTKRSAAASGQLDYGDYYSGVAYYLYTFSYPSIDCHGNEIVLSSLMAFPYFSEGYWNDGYRFNNVIIGCHCTITSNSECPSCYPTGGYFKSDVSMMQYYASWGKGIRKDMDDPAYYNVLIMPDYEGYGITKDRPHPYLYQELTARQVVDGVRYGMALFRAGRFAGKNETVSPQWAQRSDAFRYGKYIPIGASQGGSVAMAVHRFIEQNGLTGEMPLAGSVCCDGPYDPVATLKYFMRDDLDAGHEAGELSMPVAIALIIKGMLDTNPLMMKYKATDFFSQTFIDTGILDIIADKQYEAKEKTTTDIEKYLQKLSKQDKYQQMLTSDGRARLEYVLTPRAYEYMQKLAKGEPLPDYEEMDDLARALESNNMTVGWVPQQPVCLFHSTKDTVVPYDNYRSAKSRFSSNGCTLYLDDSDTGDHVPACSNFMFTFFGASPDIKFIRTLFDWGSSKYTKYTGN